MAAEAKWRVRASHECLKDKHNHLPWDIQKLIQFFEAEFAKIGDFT